MLATISDRNRGVSLGGSTVDHFNPVILDANDYYPFGSIEPGRTYAASIAGNYRYGFNGKENDNEVEGIGDQQDYGMRIYDPRVGRFLSMDPLTKKYPGLTPYQFANNIPISGIDLDGAEYVGTIKPFDSKQGNGWDYIAAVDNGVIDVINLGPQLWNSLVANIQSARRGTWAKDITKESKELAGNVKDIAVNTYQYTAHTPIKQQLIDNLNVFKDPQTYRLAVSLLVGSKLKVPEFSSTLDITTTAAKTIVGQWVTESTAGWSERAIEYQEYVTGVKAGNAFEVRGVRFDGVEGNALLDAKSSYNNFINTETGEFYSWFKGQKALIKQAQSQIIAADGAEIIWKFDQQATLDATAKLFEQNNIEGITLKFEPLKK